jgi:hypothetical protein
MRTEARVSGGRRTLHLAAALVVVLFAIGCRTSPPHRNVELDPTLKARLGSAETGELGALPEGSIKVLVSERCLSCHGAGLIAQQHKDATAWDRTVTQMRAWGTPIQDADQRVIVAYLAEHFGPSNTRR